MAGVRLNKGTWTREEHEAFLRGVRLFERGEWEAMATLVPTRTVVQIRSHSQKYFREIDRGEVFPKEPYPSQYSTAAGQAGAAAGAYLYGVPLKEQQQQHDQKHDQPHDKHQDQEPKQEPKQEQGQKQEQEEQEQEQLRQQEQQQEQQRFQQQRHQHEQQTQQQLQQLQQYLQQQQQHHHQQPHVNQQGENVGAPVVMVQGQMQPPLTYPMSSWGGSGGGSGGSSGPSGIIVQPGLPHRGFLVDDRQHQTAAAAAAGPVNRTAGCARYMGPQLVDPFSPQGSRSVGGGGGGGGGGGSPSSYSYGPRGMRGGAETGHPGTFGVGSPVGRPVRFGGSNGVPAQAAPMPMAMMAMPNQAATAAGAIGVSANSRFAAAYPPHCPPPGWQSGGVPGGISPPLHQGWQPGGGGVQYGGGSGMVSGCCGGVGGFQLPSSGGFCHFHVGGAFPHPASCGRQRVVRIQEQQYHRFGPPPMPGAATGTADGVYIGEASSAEQQQQPHGRAPGGLAPLHGRPDVPSARDGTGEAGDEIMDGGEKKRPGKRDRREKVDGGGNGDVSGDDDDDEDDNDNGDNDGDVDKSKGSNRRRHHHQQQPQR